MILNTVTNIIKGALKMKKSLINDYLKALNTIVNDNCISFSITGNFADKCSIVTYFCDKTVVYNFTLFNDSSIVTYDDLINHYHAIMLKHPIRGGNKQLFSLRFDSKGYCSLATTDSSNLELFGVSHKRISKKLADYLFNDVAIDSDYYISDYCHRYNTTFDFLQTIIFKI